MNPHLWTDDELSKVLALHFFSVLFKVTFMFCSAYLLVGICDAFDAFLLNKFTFFFILRHYIQDFQRNYVCIFQKTSTDRGMCVILFNISTLQATASLRQDCFQHAENFRARDAVKCSYISLSVGNSLGVL